MDKTVRLWHVSMDECLRVFKVRGVRWGLVTRGLRKLAGIPTTGGTAQVLQHEGRTWYTFPSWDGCASFRCDPFPITLPRHAGTPIS